MGGGVVSARSKPAPERRTRSGPTQPEDQRKRRQWKLRVSPEVRDLAHDRAAARGQDVSAYVSELVLADASRTPT